MQKTSYMVVTTYARNISVLGLFHTLAGAKDALRKDFANVLGCKPEEVEEFLENEDPYEMGFDGTSAYANDVGCESDNYDARIFSSNVDGEVVPM